MDNDNQMYKFCDPASGRLLKEIYGVEEEAAIWTHRTAGDRPGMVREGEALRSRGRIPHNALGDNFVAQSGLRRQTQSSLCLSKLLVDDRAYEMGSSR
jgi:hypothetical protein